MTLPEKVMTSYLLKNNVKNEVFDMSAKQLHFLSGICGDGLKVMKQSFLELLRPSRTKKNF